MLPHCNRKTLVHTCIHTPSVFIFLLPVQSGYEYWLQPSVIRPSPLPCSPWTGLMLRFLKPLEQKKEEKKAVHIYKLKLYTCSNSRVLRCSVYLAQVYLGNPKPADVVEEVKWDLTQPSSPQLLAVWLGFSLSCCLLWMYSAYVWIL